jgi:hypothetical protein
MSAKESRHARLRRQSLVRLSKDMKRDRCRTVEEFIDNSHWKPRLATYKKRVRFSRRRSRIWDRESRKHYVTVEVSHISVAWKDWRGTYATVAY